MCTECHSHELVAAQVLRQVRGRLRLVLDGRRQRVHETSSLVSRPAEKIRTSGRKRRKRNRQRRRKRNFPSQRSYPTAGWRTSSPARFRSRRTFTPSSASPELLLTAPADPLTHRGRRNRRRPCGLARSCQFAIFASVKCVTVRKKPVAKSGMKLKQSVRNFSWLMLNFFEIFRGKFLRPFEAFFIEDAVCRSVSFVYRGNQILSLKFRLIVVVFVEKRPKHFSYETAEITYDANN